MGARWGRQLEYTKSCIKMVYTLWRHFEKRSLDWKYFNLKWNLFDVCPFDNKSAFVQVMDCCLTDDKQLPGPMMTQFTEYRFLHIIPHHAPQNSNDALDTCSMRFALYFGQCEFISMEHICIKQFHIFAPVTIIHQHQLLTYLIQWSFIQSLVFALVYMN